MGEAVIDQGVFLALALVALALVLLGAVGILVSRLTQRDREIRAARQEIARGKLTDPNLMAVARDVRDEK